MAPLRSSMAGTIKARVMRLVSLVLPSDGAAIGVRHFCLLIFATCLAFYLLFWSGHQYSIDGVVMFQNAKSLAFQHSFVMNPPVRWGSDIHVSVWAMGLTFAYVPVLNILSKTVFAGDGSFMVAPYDPNILYNGALLVNRPYLYASLLHPVVTATTAALLFLVALELGLSKRKSSAIALVFGMFSPAAVYAKFDYAQSLASLLLLSAFLFLLLSRRQRAHIYLILCGLSLGLAVLTRIEMVVTAVPLFILCIYLLNRESVPRMSLTRPPVRLLLAFGSPVFIALVGNQYFNYLRWGSWLSLGYAEPQGQFTFEPWWVALALLENFVSPGRGMFVFFPLACLAILGGIRSRRDPVLLAMLLSVLASLLFYSTWTQWPAGLSWGPRFFIPYLPYLTILCFLGL